MTKDILSSDVDLVDGLIKSGQTDDGIVAALLLRGIEETKASKLVHDLRHGNPVAPEIYATPVLKHRQPRQPGTPERG